MTKKSKSKPVLKTEAQRVLGSAQPLSLLKTWLKMAQKTRLKEPWAMHLSTSYKGVVTSRIVLLKKIHKNQLVFFTNYTSVKARQMEKNPQVAACFYWDSLEKQVRLQGRVKKIPRKQTLLYWKTRRRGSQISQWVSQQSQSLPPGQTLEGLKKAAEEKFKGRKIPCPLHWGGYLLSIEKIEFWKNRAHRLHDRFLFEKKGRDWKIQRLFP